MAPRLTTKPVTADNWDDFAKLFTSRGCPQYCWCTVYRFSRRHEMGKSEKRAAMRGLVKGGTPIGILAYDDGEPVGWCSVAPRGSYQTLARSRTMPTVPDGPTWTVLCFFVKRDHRNEGLAHKLLESALAYAKREGADVVEAYPFDTAGTSSTHRGHSSVFAAAGFEQDGRRWSKRLRASPRGGS